MIAIRHSKFTLKRRGRHGTPHRPLPSSREWRTAVSLSSPPANLDDLKIPTTRTPPILARLAEARKGGAVCVLVKSSAGEAEPFTKMRAVPVLRALAIKEL
jgi:hypothetical protein